MSRHLFIAQFLLFIIAYNFQASAQEKVMLSTDRDIYISGESIWFNVGTYKLDSNEPSKLSKVVHVELMNQNNVSVVQLKYRLNEQCSQSKFLIPDSLSTGNYSLRAYTRWMENKDEGLFAKKNISIINPFAIDAFPRKDQYFLNDTIFTFPEGGIIYPGVENKVVIRAYNVSREPKAIEGTVVDEDNEVVSSFKTNIEGYGFFKFTPKKNVAYFYCSDSIRVSLPKVSNKKIYLKLNKQNSNIYSFNVYGELKSNIFLDIVSKDGAFNKRYEVPRDGCVVVKDKDLVDEVLFALIVDDKNDILAYRVFSKNNKDKSPDIQLNTSICACGKREKVKLEINQIKSLKNISVSVVNSCLLNSKINKSNLMNLDGHDVFVGFEPPIFENNKEKKLLLPEFEGELITGVITYVETGEPIIGEKFMLSFVSKTPVMKFSTTDSLGRFRFVVNQYGQKEMVIQPFSNDSTLLNYKVTIDEKFSSNYSIGKNQSLVLDSVNAERINEAIVNMQINTIYSVFRKNSSLVDPVQDLGPFYEIPNVSTSINKYIGLATVEELVREVVSFTGVRKNDNGYYFRVYEKNSLYPRECKTLTFMDGVPIKNVGNIFKVLPQDLDKIDVVNLNFYLKDEELGYLLCFYSKDNNMADMEFDQRIFRQVHKGFVSNYTYQSPNYSNFEVKNSHIADFRNVLYYNVFPNMNEKNSVDIEFFTSDEETEYTIVVKGINEQGEFVEKRKNIVVSEHL